jgi:predicted permease
VRWPWSRRRLEAELEEEIRGHLEMAAHDHVTRGESPQEAAYAARREFGNATLVKEVTRQAWGGAWLDPLLHDVRLAARSLRRSPAFTLSVVVLLGLGLGAAAAMYGILDRLVLRAPEHLQDPEHLYASYISQSMTGGVVITRGVASWYESGLMAGASEGIAGAAVYGGPSGANVDIGGEPVRAQATVASADYFAVLGVRPEAGRFFVAGDSGAGAQPVAVISHGFWRRQFASRAATLGMRVGYAGRTFTIVGVAPSGFSGTTPERTDIWFGAESGLAPSQREFGYGWQSVIRLKGSRPPSHVAAEILLRLQHAQAGPHAAPTVYTRVRLTSTSAGSAPLDTAGALRLPYLVAGAAAALALIAVANAAALLMLRGLRRSRETAVRVVLGVTRWRLLVSVALESGLLALAAGLAACAVAAAGGEALRKLLLGVDWAVPVVDPRVALLTLLASLAVGSVVGLVPGWLAGRPHVVAALKAGVHDLGFRRAPGRTTLLVVQSALSVTLLAGVGLYARSFERARAFDFGPDVDHVLAANLFSVSSGPGGHGFTTQAGVMTPPADPRALVARVLKLPGVQAAALANLTPLWGRAMVEFRVEGLDSFPRGHFPTIVETTRDYFAAVELPVIRGRLFADQGPGGPREAVVSEEMARALMGSGGAIGRCLYLGHESRDCRRIVGVVGDVRGSLSNPMPEATYYVPLSQAQSGPGAGSLVVRSQDPARLVPLVRQVVASLAGIRDPEAVRTLREIVDPQYRRLRQGLALFGIFAGLAIVIAMTGMYAVVAYGVTQRAHEFGVRVALGAQAASLVRLVMSQALRYAGAGLLLGLVFALVGGRYVAPLLYQTSARDPLVLGVAALALLLAAALACVIPAGAAARADPRRALQAE